MKKRYNTKSVVQGLLLISVALIITACGQIQEGLDQDTLDYWAIVDYLSERNIEAQGHSSGLQVVLNGRGSGISPVPGDSAVVAYNIYLFDGTLVDTTDEELAKSNGLYSPNRTYGSFVFMLGFGHVIEGFEIATELLTEQGDGVFYLPSKLGYGARSIGSIDRYSNLILELELLEVRH